MRKIRLSFIALLFLAIAAVTLGCGGGSSSDPGGGMEGVTAEAFSAALDGDGERFIRLVAPSFLEEARREMPDIDDVVLGDVLIAGFTEDLAFTGIEEAVYEAEVNGDRAVVHVWGSFTGADEGRVMLEEADALPVPMVRENGRWYLDLLDL
ncbi:MAG: hypothetical protein SWK76_09765 [Actinomycetota bacterium]|nr:hypothetical protein [Actinomycetota bacterium]